MIRLGVFVVFVLAKIAFNAAPAAVIPGPVNSDTADVAPAELSKTTDTPPRPPTSGGTTLDGTWAAVEAALAINDCPSALERWRTYRLGPSPSKASSPPPIDLNQLRQVVSVCPELDPILE